MDALLERRFRKLVREAPDGWDVFFMWDGQSAVPDGLAENVHVFNFTALRAMAPGVFGGTFWGNCHLGYIDFYRRHQDYAYIWFLEYDVLYTGNWRTFFRQFEDDETDLLGEHMRYSRVEPDWFWLPSFSTGNDVLSEDQSIAALLAIFRISNRALKALDDRVIRGLTLRTA